MVKPELGTKRLCPTCGGKFYDLHKSPAECPYCEAVFNPDDLTRGKRPASRPAPEEPKPVEKKPPKKEAAEDEDENLDDLEVNDVETDDDEDDEILEDASDLGEDEEDVAEVMDNVERPEGGD